MTSVEREQKENEVYRQYRDVIAPFVAELEVRDVEYPIEIFNEIRSVFTHISRYKLQNSEQDLLSAGRHIKRAILDCYKYLCISMAEELFSFRQKYQTIDLHLADNGRFLPELDRLEANAKNCYLKAKKAETAMQVSDDELYCLYEDAFNSYSEAIRFKEESADAILFASNHSKNADRINSISIIVTLISIAVAIAAWFF